MTCVDNLKCGLIPQRFILSVMGFFALAVSNTMRSCLSIAITEMVSSPNKTGTDFVGNYSSDIKFDWSQEEQGWILSSFYIGYVISHVPGGLLAQKFGGKWTLSLGVLVAAICNAVLPKALEYGGFYALILLRISMGLAGGVSYPALTVFLAAWIPEKERSVLGSIVLGGSQAGTLLSIYVSGLILSNQSWPAVFYFWSAVSLIWFIAFTLLCYSDPASHPFITKKECDYLKSEIGQLQRHSNLPPTPWKDILTSVPIIVLIISEVGNNFLWVIMATDLPKYMKEVVGFSAHDVGLYSSLPYLLLWIVSIVSGFLCDFLINRHILTIIKARKLFTALSGIFPAIFVVAASYAECNRVLVVTCFVLAMGFLGNYYPGMRVNALDLAPNYAGSIIAVTNGFGSLTAIVAPVFVGMMIPDSSLEQWRMVFWITFVIEMSRIIMYLIWASADVQPWNNLKDSQLPEGDKLSVKSQIPE